MRKKGFEGDAWNQLVKWDECKRVGGAREKGERKKRKRRRNFKARDKQEISAYVRLLARGSQLVNRAVALTAQTETKTTSK